MIAAARPRASRIERQVTFRVADERFALPASAVREIVRRPLATRVPQAPDSLIGLGNLRGTVLPLVSVATLLGGSDTQGRRVIVLERADPVGLVVDEVSGVNANGEIEEGARPLDLARLLAGAFATGRKADRVPSVGAITAPVPARAPLAEIVLLAFAVGDQDYALPLHQIDGVLRLPADITLLPEAEAVAVGTIAHRSGLLPLLSLQALLGLPRGAASDRARVVVLRIGAHRIGLVVDTIRSILRIDESVIDAVPAVLTRGAATARVQAICRLGDGRRLVSILAAEHLVRGDLTAHLLHSAAGEEEDVTRQRAEDTTEQFLIFRLDDQDFGIPIAAVSEVAMAPETLTRLPKAPAFVEGVMNLRGQVVPVVDQGLRFQGRATGGRRRRVIVVTLGKMRIGFAVDAVSEVLRLPATALRDAPAFATGRTRIFDRVATFEDDGRMILIVEPQELVDRAERDLLAAMADGGGMAGS